MARVIPGTNGTIKALTIEGQLQEICMYLRLGQSSSTNNPNQIENVVSVSHSPDTLSFGASFSFGVNQLINNTGQITYSAVDYLTGLTFTPGENGTFKSTTAAGYFLEALIYAQNLERQATKNPTNRNGVSGTFNSDNTIFSGSLDLPILVSVEPTGEIKYTADEYLLD